VTTKDEEKQEAAPEVEAATDETAQGGAETDDAVAAAPVEEATQEAAPEAPKSAEDVPQDEPAPADHGSDHGHGHAPSPTHFPMDENEAFERQVVARYTDTGHEYDPPRADKLIVFTVLLTLVILLSAVGLMQWFQAEKDAMLAAQAAAIPAELTNQRTTNAQTLQKAGPDAARNTSTVTIGQAKKAVARNKSLLRAFANPPAPNLKKAAPEPAPKPAPKTAPKPAEEKK
jgi:hypothetical protein